MQAPADTAPAGRAPVVAAEPLRNAVLSGRLLGAGGRAAAALGEFAAAETGALSLWFGAAMAERLAADADALRGMIDRDVAAIDALIAAQIDAILHHPRLRQLEGSWRGLRWLVARLEGAARIKIRVLHLPWAELARDLARAPEFDQSNLFRRVYEDEFGMPGGEPFGMLLVDHELRHRPMREAPTDDLEALAQLSAVAAAAFAPTVLAASPALLDLDTWSDMALAADPASPLRDADHAGWRALGDRADMRFIGVVLPRLLARPPWRDDPARPDGFRYREYAPDAASRVWMNAGYALAAAAMRAFAQFAWPADIRGIDTGREGGGLVDALPAEDYRTDPPAVVPRPPLDIILNDRQERALVEAGLIPVVGLPHGAEAAFVALRTLQTPQRFVGPAAAAANANARISSHFHAMLCVSRFAHYVKLIGRDMLGAMRTPEEVERHLQAWLNTYVDASTSSGPDLRARKPLIAGRVQVAEHPGRPGAYGCTVHLQPHFQLEDVAASFRLTTILAPLGRAA